MDFGDGDDISDEDDDRSNWHEPRRGRTRKRRWETASHQDEQQIPSLTRSFPSAAEVSPTIGTCKQVSQPLIPDAAENAVTASAAGIHKTSEWPQKRIHV
jgi:hypothetical protein